MWLPVVGFAALVLLHYGPGDRASGALAGALLLASYAPVAVFVGINRLWLVASGLVLNLIVVVANGGMPVSLVASRTAGLPDPRGTDVLWGKHVVMDDATRLRALGDVIPVPIPGFRQVISVGDVLVLAGIAWLVASAVRRKAS